MRWFHCASLCAALNSLALAAPVLSIQPVSPVVELGQPFDPAALNALGVTEGPFLAGGVLATVDFNSVRAMAVRARPGS